MDGDTAGSISPIAGVDKYFVKKWLRWAETELGYAALRHVNALQPTAELRPLADNQTDERDLMPYPLLNRIERLAFYDRLPPAAVLAQLVAEDPHADADAAAHLRAGASTPSGAATSGSASATRPHFTSMITTWTRAPGCGFPSSAAVLGRSWRGCNVDAASPQAVALLLLLLLGNQG